jgi:hypothetical protein
MQAQSERIAVPSDVVLANLAERQSEATKFSRHRSEQVFRRT